MMVIYAFGHVSGAHTNPCTTLAFTLRGDFRCPDVPEYRARTALLPQMRLGPWPAFYYEIVLTTILITVALATANQARFIGPTPDEERKSGGR